MRIDGCTALVTGANRGLGARFVDGLVARNCKVYACARRLGDLDDTVARYSGKVFPIELDVTDQAAVAAAASYADDTQILINNAGRLDQLSLGEAGDLSSLRAEMEVNVFGLAQMSLAFAPVIGKHGGGAIVNILSTASLAAPPHFGSYAATKAAAMSLTHTMRWDFEPISVKVIGVFIGAMDTDMVSNFDTPKAIPEEVVSRTLNGIEVGELDIAADDRSALIRDKFFKSIEEVTSASRQRSTEIRKRTPAKRRNS